MQGWKCIPRQAGTFASFSRGGFLLAISSPNVHLPSGVGQIIRILVPG